MMAASFMVRRAAPFAAKFAVKFCPRINNVTCKRNLLSEAYYCKEAWKSRLQDPVFSQMPLSDFAIQLRDLFEKQKTISAVDMEILANKLHEIELDEADFIEDIIKKFRRSPGFNPVRDAIIYPIVRNYIDCNLAERLIPLMKQRSETGIFPDHFAFSLLLDHFIKAEDYQNAAHVAYEMMLQEDFSHLVCRLLALYACTKHLEQSTLDSLAPPEIKDETGEEDWIPVKYIRYPTYDDHFDIQAEQYLLGKTLHLLGAEFVNSVLGNSLQVLGLGLYHKFSSCLDLLEKIAEFPDATIVQESLSYVEEALEKVQLRDPNKPPKETGLLRIEDEMYKLLPTLDDKSAFVDRLQQIKKVLLDKGKIVKEPLGSFVYDMVKAELVSLELSDIQTQVQRLEVWQIERQKLLSEQLFELNKQQKIQEIETKLKELQEKEEMLRFFELRDKIRLIQPKKKLEKEPLKEDEITLGAKRLKRKKLNQNT